MAEMADPRRVIDFYANQNGVLRPGDARLPALRGTTAPVGITERGFTMGAGSAEPITVSARPVAPTGQPLQIGYRAAKVAGPGIEGMGDFAPAAASGEARAAGGILSKAGGLLRSGLRGAFSGPGLVVQGLAIPAGAQADATKNSNLPTMDVQRQPSMFGGLRPGRSVSTGAISYTNPFNGAPVGVTQAKDQVVAPTFRGTAQAAPAPAIAAAPVVEAGYNPAHITELRGSQEQFMAAEGVNPLEYGGNVGYFSTGGAKPVLTDAGEPGRALTGNRNGVVAGQRANSSELIGSIISRQPDFVGEAKYRAEVAKAQKANEMLNGGAGYRTAADFGGDGSNSAKDVQAAAKARSYNLNLDKQMKQSELDSTNSYRQGTLALASRKQTLEEAMAPAEMESKQALSGYYRSRGAADLLKVNKDHAIEVQKLKNEQAQKALDAKNASPMAKANAEFFAALGTQAGVPATQAEAAFNAGYRTPQKAKTHWFTEDQQQGLVDASGKLYTPGAEAQPVRTGTRPNGEVWGQYADGTMKRIR